MEEICIVYVDIDGVVFRERFLVDKVLYRLDLMIEKEFLSRKIAGKAPDPIVHGNDIGIERTDEIVKR